MDCFNTVFKLPHALTEPVADKLILDPQQLDPGRSDSLCLIISEKDSSES
jgi:hypothetical protein